MAGGFAEVGEGRERWAGGEVLARHRHRGSYAALILRGGYEECGSRGRLRVGPGDVIWHAPFEAHLNRFRRAGTEILNLVVGSTDTPGQGLVDDPDAIVRAAERSLADAGDALAEQFRPHPIAGADWPDLLAADLLAGVAVRIGAWARARGLQPETASRGFRRVFGVTPAAFRAEARAHRALALMRSAPALASVACAAGFADQAHMTRAVRALTGLPPAALARSSWFKTGGARFN